MKLTDDQRRLLVALSDWEWHGDIELKHDIRFISEAMGKGWISSSNGPGVYSPKSYRITERGAAMLGDDE